MLHAHSFRQTEDSKVDNISVDESRREQLVKAGGRREDKNPSLNYPDLLSVKEFQLIFAQVLKRT